MRTTLIRAEKKPIIEASDSLQQHTILCGVQKVQDVKAEQKIIRRVSFQTEEKNPIFF